MAAVPEPGDMQLSVLQAQVEQTVKQVETLLSSLPPSHAPGKSAAESAEHDRGSELAALVLAYGEDARRERIESATMGALATVALLGCLGAAMWAVDKSTMWAADTSKAVNTAKGVGTDQLWALAGGPLLLCAATGVAAILLLRQAGARRSSAREWTRLERGLQGIGDYLSPLPPNAQHLIRATMTQNLFPRLLEDNDPLRQPNWPDTDSLLSAIYSSSPEPELEPSGEDN
jgi:hypothetical protein